MNEALINCLAEAGHNDYGDDEREDEVKVSVDEPVSTHKARHRTRNRLLAYSSHSRNLQIIQFKKNCGTGIKFREVEPLYHGPVHPFYSFRQRKRVHPAPHFYGVLAEDAAAS